MLGLCQCGCGGETNIAKVTRTNRGWIKGQPKHFLLGHGGFIKLHLGPKWEIDPRTGCWNWLMHKIRSGYGVIRVGRKLKKAHRVIYEQYKGPIASGLELDHLCRNRQCVNPDHLEPVTHAENSYRGARAKLTRHTAEQIRRLHKSGERVADIARKFSLSWTTISYVVQGKCWSK